MITLENICSYLPYGLNVTYGKDVRVIVPTKEDFYNVNKSMTLQRFIYSQGEHKPILRPMDLTKPITIDDKEIIPIEELAKMALSQKYRHGLEHVINNGNMKYFEFGSVITFKEDNSCFSFGFDHNMQAERLGFSLIRDNTIHYFLNQLSLFQWLFKNKFDVFNLITAGLAIDVNTLETNPYNQ